jgi:hypothetical protein
MKMHCTVEGCAKLTEYPFANGWAYIWWRGVADGFFCPEHAAAIDKAQEETCARHRRTRGLVRRKTVGRARS